MDIRIRAVQGFLLVWALFASCFGNGAPLIDSNRPATETDVRGRTQRIANALIAGTAKTRASLADVGGAFLNFEQINDKLGVLDLEAFERLFGRELAAKDAASLSDLSKRLVGVLSEESGITSRDLENALTLSLELDSNLKRLRGSRLLQHSSEGALAFKNALTKAVDCTERLFLDLSLLKNLTSSRSEPVPASELSAVISSVQMNTASLAQAFVDAESSKSLPGMGAITIPGLGQISNPLKQLDMVSLAERFLSISVTLPNKLSKGFLADSRINLPNIAPAQSSKIEGEVKVVVAGFSFKAAIEKFIQVRSMGSLGRDVSGLANAFTEALKKHFLFVVALKNEISKWINHEGDPQGVFAIAGRTIENSIDMAKGLLESANVQLSKTDKPLAALLGEGNDETLGSSIVWKDFLFQLGLQRSVEKALLEDLARFQEVTRTLEAALVEMWGQTDVKDDVDVVNVDRASRGVREASKAFVSSVNILMDWKTELDLNITLKAGDVPWRFTDFWKTQIDMLKKVVDAKNQKLGTILNDENKSGLWAGMSEELRNVVNNKTASVSYVLQAVNQTVVETALLKRNAFWDLVALNNATYFKIRGALEEALVADVMGLSELLAAKSSSLNIFSDVLSATASSLDGVVDRLKRLLTNVNLQEELGAVLPDVKKDLEKSMEQLDSFRDINFMRDLVSANIGSAIPRAIAEGDGSKQAIKGMLNIPPVPLKELQTHLPKGLNATQVPDFLDILNVLTFLEAAKEFMAALGPLEGRDIGSLEGQEMARVVGVANNTLAELLGIAAAKGERCLSEFRKLNVLAGLLGVPLPPTFTETLKAVATISPNLALRSLENLRFEMYPNKTLGVSKDAFVLEAMRLLNQVLNGNLVGPGGDLEKNLGLFGPQEPSEGRAITLKRTRGSLRNALPGVE